MECLRTSPAGERDTEAQVQQAPVWLYGMCRSGQRDDGNGKYELPKPDYSLRHSAVLGSENPVT
jgi:hypothetical protein